MNPQEVARIVDARNAAIVRMGEIVRRLRALQAEYEIMKNKRAKMERDLLLAGIEIKDTKEGTFVVQAKTVIT